MKLYLNYQHSFHPLTGSSAFIKLADFVFTNDCEIVDLYKKFDTINWSDNKWIRPDWDTYFLMVCRLVKMRSNCLRRAVGAVLVKDREIISTGYNGTPFGLTNCYEGGCPRCCSDVQRGT